MNETVSAMPAQPTADYDWLLAWTDWTRLGDRRVEAVFPLETFLARSGTTHGAWLLEFLSWKCERLVIDGCWYEARLDHLPGRIDVRIVMDR